MNPSRKSIKTPKATLLGLLLNSSGIKISIGPINEQLNICLEGGNNPLQTEIYGRVAVNHSWDPEEAKLLIVEARIIPGIEVFKFFLLITHV